MIHKIHNSVLYLTCPIGYNGGVSVCIVTSTYYIIMFLYFTEPFYSYCGGYKDSVRKPAAKVVGFEHSFSTDGK